MSVDFGIFLCCCVIALCIYLYILLLKYSKKVKAKNEAKNEMIIENFALLTEYVKELMVPSWVNQVVRQLRDNLYLPDDYWSSSDYVFEDGLIKDGYLIYRYSTDDTYGIYGVYGQMSLSKNAQMIFKISECSEFYLSDDGQYYASYETVRGGNNSSVVGRGVAGALIGGGVGAVIGAASALNKNSNGGRTVETEGYLSCAAIHFKHAETGFVGKVSLADVDYTEKLEIKIRQIAHKYKNS